MPQHFTGHYRPANIVTLDQENRGIVAVIDGSEEVLFNPATDLDRLPAGGGYVVADGNCWSVRNELSQSQYCWETDAARDAFVAALAERGYRAVTVANKLANTLCDTYGYGPAHAVSALYAYVHDQVKDPKGRTLPFGAEDGAATGTLGCGCAHHWAFDSGHEVRPSRGDISHGQRAEVSAAFLRLQNWGGYGSAYAEDVIEICWNALDRRGKSLFGLAIRTPSCKSPNKLMALAACTHDPATGSRREHAGQPWGTNFIVRHVIGLNGAMRGTGDRAPGNPMRSVLRALGRRNDKWQQKNPAERAEMDRYVRVLIRALNDHPQLRPAWPQQGAASGAKRLPPGLAHDPPRPHGRLDLPR